MQIVYQKSDGLVMYAGANLTAQEITNLGAGWCDRRVTPALAAVATVTNLPDDWLPDCYTFNDVTEVFTVVPGKEYLLEQGTTAVGGYPPPQPTNLEVAITNEITGAYNSFALLNATFSWDDMGISVAYYEVAYRKETVPSWTAAPTTPEAYSVIKGLGVADYYFRVRSVSTEGIPSENWSEIGPITVASIGASGIPQITGLEIWGQGNNYEFTGRDVRFKWNQSTGIYDPALTEVGSQTDWHIGYKIHILNTDLSLRREVYTTNNEYQYSYEDNLADGSGTPVRAFQILVWDQFMSGYLSDDPAAITVNNPQVAAVTVTNTLAFTGGFAVTMTLPNEPDIAGVIVSGNNGMGTFRFSPSTHIGLNCPAETYQVTVAAYDSFGEDNLNSSTFEVTVQGSVQPAEITGWAEEITKFFKVPVLQGETWDNNTPGAGQVQWNGHSLYYQGVKHTIALGSTAAPYVYWDSATPTLYQTTTDAAAFKAMAGSASLWQIGINDNGTFYPAWNAIPNMVIGAGWMGEASIENAHISGFIESNNFEWITTPGSESAAGWRADKETGEMIMQGVKILDAQGNIIFEAGQDLSGSPGSPAYVHVKYSDSPDGNPMNDIGGDYMGVYTDHTEAASNDPAAYVWTQIKGEPGTDGTDGTDGTNGADGVDGTSIVWQGTFASHPANPVNGWAYRNSTDGRSYVYQSNAWYQMSVDGTDGQDGTDGLSIVWQGDLASPPASPEINWAYRDTDNGYVYIWNGAAWELMVLDGSDGVDGADGTDGLSVYITYHDDPADGAAPLLPLTAAGTDRGWHTNATTASNWMTQKVDDGTTAAWGAAIKIKGVDGTDGTNGADGVDGDDGTSIVWQGTFTSHPANPVNGWAYRNSSDGRSYVYQSNAWYQMTVDGVDGQDGADGGLGVSIVWKGSLADPPANPETNWAYRDTDNGYVYIYTSGNAWELMVLDGSDGVDGTNGVDGDDGLSVYITYHDDPADGAAPALPLTAAGTDRGWHTAATTASNWMTQKVDDGTTAAWGAAIKIKGVDGTDGTNGTNGADGVDGDDGTSIVWQGTFTSHPASPQNGWAYRNSSDGRSYVYQTGSWYQMTIDGTDGQDGTNGVDGQDGDDGLSIVWHGDAASPLAAWRVLNHCYRDTDNGRVYIWNGTAWELMVLDGSDGTDGTNGTNGVDGDDGLSVYITYHDASVTGAAPAKPTDVNGTNLGWHTNATAASNWMSQKVDDGTTTAWGNAIRIKGADGTDGTNGTDGTDGVDGTMGLVAPFTRWLNLNGHTATENTLRLGPGGYPETKEYYPVDNRRQIRVRFYAKPSSDVNGRLYFCLRQYLDNAGTPAATNSGRSPYKPSSVTKAEHDAQFGADQWGLYDYSWTPADWQTGATFVRPTFLDNYAGTVGYWDIKEFTIYEINLSSYYLATDAERDTLSPALNDLAFSSESGKTWRYNGVGWDLISVIPQKALEQDVVITDGGIILSNNSRITNVGSNGITILDSEGLTLTDTNGVVYNYIGRTANGDASSGDYVSLVPPFNAVPKVVLIPKTAISYDQSYPNDDQFFRLFVDQVDQSGFRVNAELVATTGAAAEITNNNLLTLGVMEQFTTPPNTTELDIRFLYKGADFGPINAEFTGLGLDYRSWSYYEKRIRTFYVRYKATTSGTWSTWINTNTSPAYPSPTDVQFVLGGLPAATYDVQVTWTNMTTSGVSSTYQQTIPGSIRGTTLNLYTTSPERTYWKQYTNSTYTFYNLYFVDDWLGEKRYYNTQTQPTYLTSDPWESNETTFSRGDYVYTDAYGAQYYKINAHSLDPPTLAELLVGINDDTRIWHLKSKGHQILSSVGEVQFIAYDGG